MAYNSLNENNTPPHSPSYNPYHDSQLDQSTGFITPHSEPVKKRKISPWIKFGIPILILVIIGAVVGGVLGTRKSKNSEASGSSDGSSSDPNSPAASSGSDASASAQVALGFFPTATNSKYMVPLYPTGSNTAFSSPTFVPAAEAKAAWPEDSFKPSNPAPTRVRPDRPRLIAPQYKWDALPELIAKDPYMRKWNDTIFGNATQYYGLAPVEYFMDGDSGILDNAREIKMRVKAFAYVYRLTKDTKWVDRTWTELQNAAGRGSKSFGSDPDRWNAGHFLDPAEFTAAFAIAYDWLYDVWTDDQKSSIRATMIQYGLSFGVRDHRNSAWWSVNTFGNWNCVCNGGLTMGALAILGDDTTGTAETILGYTIPNARANCARAPTDDGSWAETNNYWYFGTTGHAEMVSSLLTATGSDHGMLSTNEDFWKTGMYHMYSFGPGTLFDYGDHGPNKFSTTANSMMLYGSSYNQPAFTLHQRDQADAAEPNSMFWYDPRVEGAYWNGMDLDRFFDNRLDQWASMRSSWTDHDALYVAIKAGMNKDHATHNDLDAGDFVLDAMGTRWAGELGSADYRQPTYFRSGAQDADRWKWYRKMTAGQNTILLNRANQNVDAAPRIINRGTTGEKQSGDTAYKPPSSSKAFWVADLSSAYFGGAVKRGLRLLNGRRQVLLQDEIQSSNNVQWRMHTNATVTTDGTSATLELDGKTMSVQLINPPSGASFSTSRAVRFASDPAPPAPDQENPGVTVLIVDLPAGEYNLQVLFNPRWEGMQDGDFVVPKSVPLDSWSLTSHD